MPEDSFAEFENRQREMWSSFAPSAVFTMTSLSTMLPANAASGKAAVAAAAESASKAERRVNELSTMKLERSSRSHIVGLLLHEWSGLFPRWRGTLKSFAALYEQKARQFPARPLVVRYERPV